MTDESQQPSDHPFRESISTSSERIELIIEAAERAAAGIIEDAENQARGYMEESRRRADEIADERARVLSGLADSLLNRAEAVKEQSADLILALESARSQIADHIADYRNAGTPEPPPFPEPTSSTPPVVTDPEPVAEPADDEQATVVVSPSPEGDDGDGSSADEISGPEGEETTAVETESQEEAKPEPAPVAPPPPSRSRGGAEPSAGARLLATQMAVAGSSREEIADRLEHEFGIADPETMLDAILGPRS